MGSRRVTGTIASMVSAVVLVTACALPFGRSSDVPNLGVMNGTTIPVTLVVNGRPIADLVPGEGRPSVDADLPALPWTVEARTPSGRVLTSMQVRPGDITSTSHADGTDSSQGTFGRAELSCGQLTIWAGDVAPTGPGANGSQGTAGDCAP